MEGTITEIKESIIQKYGLNKETKTKHNNIYQGSSNLVLIENTLTGQLKIKLDRR